MTSIFISRELDRESPFLQQLAAAGCQVTGQSLVEFSAVSFREWPPVEWIFFSSPRAVRFFLEGLTQSGAALPAGIRLAVLGAGTARALDDHQLPADFVGTGDPATAAEGFLALARGQRVLFPRARTSKRSVQQLLGEDVRSFEIVVYENVPSPRVPEKDFEVLVFTSPLNAQAFFSKKKRRAGQRVVAIGTTTARALEALGVDEVIVAARPSEEELASVVLNLLEKE